MENGKVMLKIILAADFGSARFQFGQSLVGDCPLPLSLGRNDALHNEALGSIAREMASERGIHAASVDWTH